MPRNPPIAIRTHEAVPGCGSYEVRFVDGRPSVYFYWDNVPSRRLRSDIMTGDEALAEARALARTERDKILRGAGS